MVSSSSLRNQEARWQNSVNSSNPEPGQRWWESKQPPTRNTPSMSISLMTSFSPSYSSLKSPISPDSLSSLQDSLISDSVTGQICEESFLLGSWKYRVIYAKLTQSDLPSHHAKYSADSICRDYSLTVRESIKTLLQNHHLSRVQVVPRLMNKVKNQLKLQLWQGHNQLLFLFGEVGEGETAK